MTYRNRPAPTDPADPADSADSEATTSPLRELSYADCERVLRRRTFVSQEELLQLFFDMYHTRGLDDVVFRGATLTALKENLRTYFPIARCEEVTLADGVLTMRFDSDHAVAIPGTHKQASVSLSKELAFDVRPVPGDRRRLVLQVKRGGLRINTSSIMKMMSPFAVDMQATSLVYGVDPTKKESMIGVTELRWLRRDQMVVTASAEEVVVDAQHPDLPSERDLVFRVDEYTSFGLSFKLLEDGKVAMNGGNIIDDRETSRGLEILCAKALADPEEVLADGWTQELRATYQLEKGQLQFNVGLKLPAMETLERPDP